MSDHDQTGSIEKQIPKDRPGACCIAIPLAGGALSSHFGRCEEFAIVHVDNNMIVNVEVYTPPEHAPGIYPRWLAGFNVTDVIAGGVGQRAIELFNQNQINVFVGAPIKSSRELVEEFIEGRLDLKANYCDHDRQHGHGQGPCKHH